MSVWTQIKCDYFNGTHFCTRQFRTQLTGERALQEARTYGWSSTKRGIRCSQHRDTPSVRTSSERGA